MCRAGAGVPAHPVPHSAAFLPEEAVNEVKRQAMSELQKAVSDAERKAHELITTERAKMERALAEAKRQASEDALTVINQQEDSSEVGAGGDRVCGSKGRFGTCSFCNQVFNVWACKRGYQGGCGNTTGWEEKGISCSELGMERMVRHAGAWSGTRCMVQVDVRGPGWGCTVWNKVHGPGWRGTVQNALRGLG